MSTKMNDGFQTKIKIGALDGGVVFWEKSVKPPGMSAGGEIDTTTMRNTAWRTKQPKALKTLTNATTTVAYSSDAMEEIASILGVVEEITITQPDGGTQVFYGWLDSFEPNPNTEGEQPTAEIVIIPSNEDPESGEEAAPAYSGEGGPPAPGP